MKLRTWIVIGTVGFATWRGYKNMKGALRRNAETARAALMRARARGA